MPSDFPGIRFHLFTQRKQRSHQLVLAQREQEIALVFLWVTSALEQCSSGILARFKSRKMARRNELRTKLVRPINEPAELEILIAHDARVRRAASLVFVGEVLDHLRLELFRFINQIIRNAELMTHCAGVRNGFWPPPLL